MSLGVGGRWCAWSIPSKFLLKVTFPQPKILTFWPENYIFSENLWDPLGFPQIRRDTKHILTPSPLDFWPGNLVWVQNYPLKPKLSNSKWCFRTLPNSANVHGRLRGELLHGEPRLHDRGSPPRAHVLLRGGRVQRGLRPQQLQQQLLQNIPH